MKKNMIFGKHIPVVVLDLSGENFDGAFSPIDQKIFMDRGLKRDAYRDEVLYHERLHAVWDRLGLGGTDISMDLQEIIVEAFSTYTFETYTLKEKK